MSGSSDVRNAKHCLNYKWLFQFVFVLALSTVVTEGKLLEVSESEQIALESSEELLPPKHLTETIEQHLKAIREKYPQVSEVKHQGKWQAGEVIVSDGDAAGKINSINTSQYGPIETNTIFSTDTLKIYLFKFSRPYNPQKLATVLEKEFSLHNVEPNGSTGNSMEITYKSVSPTSYKYTFKKGWGDCFSGCINNHFWDFSVQVDDGILKIGLEKERGDEI